MAVTEIITEEEVDVPEMLKNPLPALAPMLVKIRGWEEVRAAHDLIGSSHGPAQPLHTVGVFGIRGAVMRACVHACKPALPSMTQHAWVSDGSTGTPHMLK